MWFLQRSRLFVRRHTTGPFFWSDGATRLQEGGGPMKSLVIKRSVVVAGHKTSVSLEDAFWSGLKEVAVERRMTLSDLVSTLDKQRAHGNLSSALRLFVLDFYRSRGHKREDIDEMICTIVPVTPARLS